MNKAATILQERAKLSKLRSNEYYNQRIDEPDAPVSYLDQAGNEVQFLSARHEMPLRAGTQKLHLGRAIVGMVTGKWNAESEMERLAMSGGVNTVGGVLVNDELSSMVLDYARAKSVCVQAGALTVPMNSDRLTIARQISDPTIEVKTENAAFAEGSITFDAVGFSANTFGAVVSLSRELAADAPNAADVVQNALTSALAVSLDRFMLIGTGSAQPVGLITNTSVGSTGSIGAIAWEDLHDAVVALQVLNCEPNAYVGSPTIVGDLNILVSGDGANAAKTWLGPPPSVAPLRAFSTSTMPNTDMFIGDFTKAVFALRQEGTIEMTTEGGEAFMRHQVKIKLTYRGDVGFLRPTFFHKLAGITT